LTGKAALLDEVRRMGRDNTLTLLYAAKDRMHNQAAVLRNVLLRQGEPGG
jgi:uncharacterized protein YeaO (DUF488 family)